MMMSQSSQPRRPVRQPWWVRAVLFAALTVLFAGCGGDDADIAVAPRAEPARGAPAEHLEEVVGFPERQITGVAVSHGGRIFVNVPHWPGQDGTEVLEVLADGSTRPYPDERWHGWTPEGEAAPGEHFVCVQSVWVDDTNHLWILDPASPRLAGVVPGGPKLLEVDLAADRVVAVHRFGPEVAPSESYLNDVRVDTLRRTAYLTDSGSGALVVVDLDSGTSRRLLAGHPSTRAEPDIVPVIGGRELRDPSGAVPRIHVDGLALDPSGEHLYYHALTGRHLYRIPTAALRDRELGGAELAARVEDLGETVVTDGMLAGAAGHVYHTALERDAIVRWSPEGGLETVVADQRLRWPDSMSWGSDGFLYFTTSQIHLSPLLGGGAKRRDPYRVWRVRIP